MVLPCLQALSFAYSFVCVCVLVGLLKAFRILQVATSDTRRQEIPNFLLFLVTSP